MRRERPHRSGVMTNSDRPGRPSARPSLAAVTEAQETGRARFAERDDVSRETLAGLDRFVALLTEWQARMNLVAPSSLGEVWERHIADSLELEALLPPFTRCADLGSGGGLPAIVVGICRSGASLDLVESSAKKCAFLRAAMRETGVSGSVHCQRIEESGDVIAAAEIVTARALAPLSGLLAFVAPHLAPGARCFFQKGRNHEQEIKDAAAHWHFAMVKHESRLEDGSVVLDIADISPR